MFKRKTKRSKWFSYLLELESLYNEGYIHHYTVDGYIWFTKKQFINSNSMVGIHLNTSPGVDVWKVELLEQYKEHRNRCLNQQ